MRVASGHQIKEMTSLGLGKPDIANFINDQQARDDVATQMLAQ